jgi:hypothetical protein
MNEPTDIEEDANCATALVPVYHTVARKIHIPGAKTRKYFKSPNNYTIRRFRNTQNAKPARKPRKKKVQSESHLPQTLQDAKDRFLALLLALRYRTISPEKEGTKDLCERDLSPLPPEIIQIIWQSFIQVCSRLIIIKHQSTKRGYYYTSRNMRRVVVTRLQERYWLSFGLRHGPYKSKIPGSCQKKNELKILHECGLEKMWLAQRGKMRKIVQFCHYKANVKHGPFIQRHVWRLPKKKKLAKKRACRFLHKSVKEFSYVEGRKHGLFRHTVHFHDGSTFLVRRGTFVDGLKSGEWVTFLYAAENSLTQGDDQSLLENSGPFIRTKGDYVAGKKQGMWTACSKVTSRLIKSHQKTTTSYYMEGKKLPKKIRDQEFGQSTLVAECLGIRGDSTVFD